MSKHTKGPWSFDDAVVGSDKTGTRICSGFEAPNWRANARLIAVAPELLETLKTTLEFYQVVARKQGTIDDSIMMRAREAIAKAEGSGK